MHISNALAGVAATESASTAEWYSRILGQPTHTPMPGVYEWKFELGGVLQVYRDPENAGHSSVTLVVEDIRKTIVTLQSLGVEILEQTTSQDVSTVQVQDSDGNRVVFAEQHSSRVAK